MALKSRMEFQSIEAKLERLLKDNSTKDSVDKLRGDICQLKKVVDTDLRHVYDEQCKLRRKVAEQNAKVEALVTLVFQMLQMKNRLFLIHGADVACANKSGESPSDLIRHSAGDTQLAAMLAKVREDNRNKLHSERILSTDIAGQHENLPIQVVNCVDAEEPPLDFHYVTSLVQTSDVTINQKINEMQHCKCRDDCSTGHCGCNHLNDVGEAANGFSTYGSDRALSDSFDMSVSDTIYECSIACRCVNSCRNRVAQKGINSRMQIFRTPNGRGWGVKILETVKRGTFICEYAGEVLRSEEADTRDDDSYLFELEVDGQAHCIDAKFYGNISRFINHSCEPNLVPIRVLWDHQDLRFAHICFFASRDIYKDEELAFDYGEKFWIIKWKEFTCKCLSANCKYSEEKIDDFLADYYEREHGNEGLDQPSENAVAGGHQLQNGF